ncbi:MAG TPA: valine--tRNA ligase [Solirubrobacterales bacterium]|nr:valine--tRNA ligase [Solirubrobacterales bacterium]HMX70561.1 valine--tRNA ligase [Solirubrobacterales bacterium]HNA23219.1 valine--tRNA ligase [Solirubrobacterales bacterium]HNA43030.1 valine--tRNA ligase [Solirubrobacterales bacterium]HNC92975.1 valine--tRNA ligase [Solirubrobacterales bacterium]
MDDAAKKKLEETTRWEPGETEPRIFAEWLEGGYFHPEATGTADQNYSVAIPPPNVTGVLHMGHALNGSMQDALVRMNRMSGRNTLWILGMDHAGIATQTVVEKRLKSEGISRHEIGREAFTERVWEWKEEFGGSIREQYKRLGASVDYERERFTLDDGYARAVRKVFTSLYEKGYIYRDHYMVNWDPGSQSAISDLEVVNEEVTDHLYSVDYPVEGSDRVLTVATVRPETMMADTAVAVNPKDERYSDLIGQHCVLPLVGRRLPIIADDHVDVEFGTGALKITPGHDVNDFEIGRRHGLEEISVIGEDGRMTAEAGERFEGMTVAEAQVEVVKALKEEGALSGEEEYVHSVPFSERSGERIEPLISLQWFCQMDELARPAIEAVEDGRVNIAPGQWKRVYLDWMREIRPWCVSRQLWWGHRIPVWYRGNETYVGETEPEGEGWVQEEDVLDTWFSSAIWPFATLGWPDETDELKAFYPTDFLTTAREILFLWVARMIMTGLEFAGDVPFHDVYVHSVIQARDGRRMSKSLGTGIDPLEEIDEHGADALRFGLLAMSSTQDVRYSDPKVQQGRDLATKLWNASRLILLNTEDPADRTVPAAPICLEDRWILSRLETTIETYTRLIGEYDFAHAAQELYSFVFSDLCDWYLEIAKPRIYDGDPEISQVLLHTLERTLALAHPVMPFVTEAIWEYHPYRQGHLVVHPFPVPDSSRISEAVETEVGEAIGVTRQLRGWRDMAGVPPKVVLDAAGDPGSVPEFVPRLGRVNIGAGEGETVATVAGFGILASDELDMEAVTARIGARRGKLEAELKKIEGKLANPRFVENAPAEVVAEEREKVGRLQSELAELG